SPACSCSSSSTYADGSGATMPSRLRPLGCTGISLTLSGSPFSHSSISIHDHRLHTFCLLGIAPEATFFLRASFQQQARSTWLTACSCSERHAECVLLAGAR